MRYLNPVRTVAIVICMLLAFAVSAVGQVLELADTERLVPTPDAGPPQKIKFGFLLFPGVVKVDVDRDLTICLVNQGGENSLDFGGGDHLDLSIPVGDDDASLADMIGVQNLACANPPAGWTCSVALGPTTAEVRFEPDGGAVVVPANETLCFDLEGLHVSATEGLVFTEMDQSIHPSAASMPLDTLLPIFKSEEGTIEHDDLAGVEPDQHHPQTWEVAGDDIYSLNSGAVGIGTTTPAGKLDVAGAGRFSGELFLNDDRTSIGGFDGAGNHWIRTAGDEGRLWMAFQDNGGVPTRIRIKPAFDFDLLGGNLDVPGGLFVGSSGGNTGTFALRNDNAIDNAISVVRNTLGFRVGTPFGNPATVKFQVSEDQTNNSSYVDALAIVAKTGGASSIGDVGIGTDDPRAQLHVSGGTGAVNMLIEADTDNNVETDHPQLTFSQDGGLTTGSLGYFGATNDLQLINDSGGARVWLLSNGDICIGSGC